MKKWIISAVAGGLVTIGVIVVPLLLAVSVVAVGVADEGHARTQPTQSGDLDYIGNGDIVYVAKSQIGNKGGEEYWSWYGYHEWVDWCACFISWCAEQSGSLQDETMPRFSSVSEVIPWFQSNSLWAGRSYTPSPGDIIFIDWDKDGTADHVELVDYATGDTVYTIGGNRGGGKGVCEAASYNRSDKVIYGYGTPKYKLLKWPAPNCKNVKKAFSPGYNQYIAIGAAAETIDPTGFPVVSARVGTVSRITQTNKALGWWTIQIDHGGGLVTEYARCLTPMVEQGDEVLAGQLIAGMSTPSADDGIALTFTVLVDGKPVDPFTPDYLSTDGISLPYYPSAGDVP